MEYEWNVNGIWIIYNVVFAHMGNPTWLAGKSLIRTFHGHLNMDRFQQDMFDYLITKEYVP